MKLLSTRESLTRRDVLKRTALGGIAFAATVTSQLPAVEPVPRELRVIAYNIYKCTGWPKNQSNATRALVKGQMPDRLAHELALYDPDIVNFSESPEESIVKQIAARMRMNYVYFPSGGNWPGALLSRHKIVQSKNVPLLTGERPKDLFTRHWGKAIIEIPGAGPLTVHSAHLYPGAAPEIRLREIALMLDAMKSDLTNNRPMLLIGDLNHGPDAEEYKLWIDAGLTDTFAVAGKGKGFTIKADNPEWRIDYVMGSGWIVNRVLESRPLFEGAFRTNPADPTSFSLSDHLPQLAVFEYEIAKGSG